MRPVVRLRRRTAQAIGSPPARAEGVAGRDSRTSGSENGFSHAAVSMQFRSQNRQIPRTPPYTAWPAFIQQTSTPVKPASASQRS